MIQHMSLPSRVPGIQEVLSKCQRYIAFSYRENMQIKSYKATQTYSYSSKETSGTKIIQKVAKEVRKF